MIHAISDLFLDSPNRLNEKQVNLLSTVLMDVLHRNPKLTTFLLEAAP